MKPVQLDFHREPRFTPWVGLAATALGVILLLTVLDRKDVLEQDASVMAEREDQYQLRKKKLQEAEAEAAKEAPANAKVAELRLAQDQHMSDALALLERGWNKDVAFTRLDISLTERTAKMELEAKTLDAALAMVDQFSAMKDVESVTVARQAVKLADPYRPIQSAIEIKWREVRP
ncbi:hypothetical protein ACTSKR_05815 [Chitinibacteraceae bacterium HSL-7]